MMVETSVYSQQQYLNELLYQTTTNIDQQFCLPADEEDEVFHDDSLIVPQHLTEEQYLFEFPPRHRLRELAYLDTSEEEYSFFDPCSFPAAYSAASAPAWHETISEEDEEDEEDLLVDDSRLSPLQLPAQVSKKATTQTSAERLLEIVRRPVGPASFLQNDDHMYTAKVAQRKGQQQNDMRQDLSNIIEEKPEEEEIYDNLHVYCNESVPVMEPDFDSSTDSSSSVRTTESRIVLIKLNKRMKRPQSSHTLQMLQQPLITYIVNDEGYADGGIDDDADELESKGIFYPLSADEEALDTLSLAQNKAATKIQAVWRGYCSRRQNKQLFSSFDPSQRAILNLTGLCGRMHYRQMHNVNERLHQLEQQLREETAMRTAFEKAMEDMTELIDQQQKALYDRLEREERARQMYEEKLTRASSHIDTLEARLKKEASARNKLEDMMTRVLDQMHETENLRREQIIEDAESKRELQAKIEQLTEAVKTATSSNTPTNLTNRKQPIASNRSPLGATSTKQSSTKTSNLKSTTTTAALPKTSVNTINTTAQSSIIPASTKINTAANINTATRTSVNTKINNTRRIINRTKSNMKNTHTPSSNNNKASSITAKSNVTALSSSKRSKEASVVPAPAQQQQHNQRASSNKRTLVPRR